MAAHRGPRDPWAHADPSVRAERLVSLEVREDRRQVWEPSDHSPLIARFDP
jgi:hypothetical protein